MVVCKTIYQPLSWSYSSWQGLLCLFYITSFLSCIKPCRRCSSAERLACPPCDRTIHTLWWHGIASLRVCRHLHAADAALQAAELHTASSAARITEGSLRTSSFHLLRGSRPGLGNDSAAAATAVALLSGWQAKPLGRAGAPAAAAAAAMAAGQAEALEQHAALASAAWVYETQWQANSGPLDPDPSPRAQPFLGTLRWRLCTAGNLPVAGGVISRSCSNLAAEGVSACLAVLRLLQHPKASNSGARLYVESHIGSGTGTAGCSGSGIVTSGTAAAGLTAALLRTAALERASLQTQLMLIDPASRPAQPGAEGAARMESEILLSAAASYTPRQAT